MTHQLSWCKRPFRLPSLASVTSGNGNFSLENLFNLVISAACSGKSVAQKLLIFYFSTSGFEFSCTIFLCEKNTLDFLSFWYKWVLIWVIWQPLTVLWKIGLKSRCSRDKVQLVWSESVNQGGRCTNKQICNENKWNGHLNTNLNSNENNSETKTAI